jgi:multidrug efflux pump subunit AcrA (membrane-fusion protein)
VKAPVHSTSEILRNAQMVKARIIWSTKPMAVVPVLAVTRQGGQSFVFVAAAERGHLWLCRRRLRWAIRWATTIPSFGAECGRQGDRLRHAVPVNGMPVMPMGGLETGPQKTAIGMRLWPMEPKAAQR